MRTAAAQLVLLVLAGIPLAAQDRARAILGVVRDTAGAPLAGIEVLLLSPRRSTLTDAAGRFRVDDVPNGMRNLLIRRIGYLPVRPSVRVPQAEKDTLQVVLLPAPQFLAPLIVESKLPGLRGVVGDTGYHALPGALVELLGARRADTTDERGRFGFEGLRQGQYLLRISRVGYIGRQLSVDLGKTGREYSIFLDEYRPGFFDWGSTHEAAWALPDLATRLALEPRRTRMTREELERYGTAALCDIPRLRFRAARGREVEPNILLRGTSWMKNVSLCGWSADEIELIEWGDDPCRESAKTIAAALGVYCGPGSRGGGPNSMTGRGPWVVLWPRN